MRLKLFRAGYQGANSVVIYANIDFSASFTPNRQFKSNNKGNPTMSTITTKDGTEIYYKDWATGQPIVLSHGWPLNADVWESQMVSFWLPTAIAAFGSG
jgi:hypothetical protein